jgi:hypothetical protein
VEEWAKRLDPAFAAHLHAVVGHLRAVLRKLTKHSAVLSAPQTNTLDTAHNTLTLEGVTTTKTWLNCERISVASNRVKRAPCSRKTTSTTSLPRCRYTHKGDCQTCGIAVHNRGELCCTNRVALRVQREGKKGKEPRQKPF